MGPCRPHTHRPAWWTTLGLSLCVLVGLAAGPARASDPIGHAGTHPFVVTGVVKHGESSALIREFVNYLSERTGYPLHVVNADTYDKLSQILRSRTDALGWTCGRPFVEDHASDNQQLIAVPLFNGMPVYHSVVLARKEDRGEQISDFHDRVLAYSDPRSNSGYLAPAVALNRAGIDIKKHFRYLSRTGLHEHAIRALRNELADVAAVDEYVWVQYRKDHPEVTRELVELERYGPFPFTPVVAADGVPPEVIQRVRRALTEMQLDPKGVEILARFGLGGFVSRDPSFYEPIRRMLREIDAS